MERSRDLPLETLLLRHAEKIAGMHQHIRIEAQEMARARLTFFTRLTNFSNENPEQYRALFAQPISSTNIEEFHASVLSILHAPLSGIPDQTKLSLAEPLAVVSEIYRRQRQVDSAMLAAFEDLALDYKRRGEVAQWQQRKDTTLECLRGMMVFSMLAKVVPTLRVAETSYAYGDKPGAVAVMRSAEKLMELIFPDSANALTNSISNRLRQWDLPDLSQESFFHA